MNGSKGGKTPAGSTKSYDINQCFVQCNSWGGTCSSKTSGQTISGDCPTDGSAKCLDIDKEWVDLYNNPLRDCYGGQGNSCTMKQPCTPCERDTLYVSLYISQSTFLLLYCYLLFSIGEIAEAIIIIDVEHVQQIFKEIAILYQMSVHIAINPEIPSITFIIFIFKHKF